jgi:thiol peroxidase
MLGDGSAGHPMERRTMVERVGEAYEFGEQLTVVGDKLQPGDPAPDFALESFDPVTGAMQTVHLADSDGTVRLLNVVNSLDTPVCHVETRRWETLRKDLPPGVVVHTISMDLPFAQARWRQAENVEHQALSAHKDETFGTEYGVLLKEWRLLQRAVFVVDRDDRIAHVEYVPDQMAEPDYDAAVEAARRLAQE